MLRRGQPIPRFLLRSPMTAASTVSSPGKSKRSATAATYAEGHKIMVAGKFWVYHDPPGSVMDLLRKSFRYGVGHSLQARKSPERRLNVLPLDRWYRIPTLAAMSWLSRSPSSFITTSTQGAELNWVSGRSKPFLIARCCAAVSKADHGAHRKPLTKYMGRKGAAKDGDCDARSWKPDAGSKVKKILYLDAYPKFGGGQQVVYNVVSRLDRSRYRPLVAVPPHNPFRERLADVGIRSVGIDFRESNYRMPSLTRPLSVPLTLASMLRVICQITRLAKREKADLIHANSAAIGVHAVPAAALLGLPIVVHAHDFLTAHLTNWLLTLLMSYKRASMIFVSRALAEHYNAARHSYPYRVIHNGVDSALFSPDPTARHALLNELGLPPYSFLIGAIGRLERMKGFDLVIQAFATVVAEHPQARLLIVGDVDFDRLRSVKDDLMQLARDLGISDKVVFTGFRSDVPRIMAGIDVLAHCPRTGEGFSMILTEAMACARPVVTVGTGGTVEQIEHGLNGFLVPPKDIAALANAIARLVADPEMARKMGAEGRRIVEERLMLEKQAAEIDRYYADSLDGDQTLPRAKRKKGRRR